MAAQSPEKTSEQPKKTETPIQRFPPVIEEDLKAKIIEIRTIPDIAKTQAPSPTVSQSIIRRRLGGF